MVWTTKPPIGTQLDFTKPINNGLVGCWIFNEGTGTTVNDLSGNNNSGTIYGTSNWISDGRLLGRPSLSFNAIDNYIDFGNPTTLQISTDITISAFIYINIIDILRFVCSKRAYSLVINIDEPGFSTRKADDSTQDSGSFGNSIITGVWYHIVGTYNTTTQQKLFYLNGVPNLPVPKTDGAMGDYILRNFQIGKHPTTGLGLFNGYIDEVRIWNRALTKAEISQLYSNPYEMFIDTGCPPLTCTLIVT